MKLTTNAPDHGLNLQEYGLRFVAAYDEASRVTYSASELTWILGTEFDTECLSIFIFPADEMATFCKALLWSRLLPGSSLSIAITGIALTTTSILKLLKPLHRLYGLDLVRITGQVSDNCKSILIEKLMKQAPEINTAVQEVQDTIEQGDQAARKQDYSLAIAKYKSAAIDNDYNECYPPEINECTVSRGKYQGYSLYKAYIVTYLTLSAKVAITYLKIENHSRAHEWINSALALHIPYGHVSGARSRGAIRAALYCVAAQASEGLGLVRRAVEEMTDAVRHDPGNSKMATELVRLKEKM